MHMDITVKIDNTGLAAKGNLINQKTAKIASGKISKMFLHS